jgi:hypothetical protein
MLACKASVTGSTPVRYHTFLLRFVLLLIAQPTVLLEEAIVSATW